MTLPVYTDFIVKYTPEQPLERSWMPRIRLQHESSYSYIDEKSRFVDVSEMLESLYSDKLISYTRTDSNVISVDLFEERFDILDAIAESNYHNKDIMNLLIQMDINHMKPDCWVEQLNFSHNAIHPIASVRDMRCYFLPKTRPYDVVREVIYTDICKSYIKLFIPD